MIRTSLKLTEVVNRVYLCEHTDFLSKTTCITVISYFNSVKNTFNMYSRLVFFGLLFICLYAL